jgi:hypothetical protein
MVAMVDNVPEVLSLWNTQYLNPGHSPVESSQEFLIVFASWFSMPIHLSPFH